MFAELHPDDIKKIAETRELVKRHDAWIRGCKISGAQYSANTPYGWKIQLPRARQQVQQVSGIASATKMVIATIEDDVLICQRWDETEEEGVGDPIDVAKPWDLRVTPFDGVSVNGFTYAYSSQSERESTKDSDSTTEDQIVIPEYFVGALIYVIPMKTETLGGEPVKHLDLNTAARAWAMDE